MKKHFDEPAFRQAVRDNVSVAGVIRTLGRAVVGSNYAFVKKMVGILGLDTTHWKGQGHGTSPQRHKKSWQEILVRDSLYRIGRIRKKRLLKDGLLENKCYLCGMGPEWMGKPLVLILDHNNGDRTDNRLENLRLVCPNCNSQLPTFCGKNIRRQSHGASTPVTTDSSER